MKRLRATARVGLFILVTAFVVIAAIYVFHPRMLPASRNAASVNPTTELIEQGEYLARA